MKRGSVHSIAAVRHAVCRRFDVAPADLVADGRARSIILPRQVAMHLARRMTGKTWPQIGHHFGGRHHATAIYAHNRVRELRQRDPSLNATVRAIVADLNGGAS